MTMIRKTWVNTPESSREAATEKNTPLKSGDIFGPSERPIELIKENVVSTESDDYKKDIREGVMVLGVAVLAGILISPLCKAAGASCMEQTAPFAPYLCGR